MPPELHERIKTHAYYLHLWFRRWGAKDDHLRDYYMAEKEVLQEIENERLSMGIAYQEAMDDKH